MKLMDQVRDAIGKKHYSIRTEAAHVKRIKDFIFHGVCHPNDMKEEKIAQYIFYLTTDRRLASSTRNQALCALVISTNTSFAWKCAILDPWKGARSHRICQWS